MTLKNITSSFLFIVTISCSSLFAQSLNGDLPHISTGVVIPEREVILATKIMGRIESIPYTEGQLVKQGDLLIKLDDAELRAELASAQASANLARAELKHLDKREVRLRRLYKNKSLSEDAMDDARFSVSAARAKLRIAEAAVKKIQVLLRETEVRAPFDAIITRKQAEVGAVTQPGGELLELESHTLLKFRTQIKEKDVPYIHIGKAVAITIDALGDKALKGIVEKLIPSGNIKTHAFLVEIALPKKPGLYPGMFGKVRF